MDGMPQPLIVESSATSVGEAAQRSVKSPIDCVGIGVHSGRRIRLQVTPAPPDHGIVFRRVDLDRAIPARFDHVVDTRLCTVLGDPRDPAVRVGTVEHILAALAACAIDNALIEVDGPEIPILDGSAAPFLFLLDCAGVAELAAPRRAIEVLRPVRVSDGAAFVELRPARAGQYALDMALSIDFTAPAIGRQAYEFRLTEPGFRRELAAARTFALAEEVEQLQAAGLALGGNLHNAIVVDGARVLNPGGLRMPNEFVRHKVLDAVGDLALAGAAIRGRFVAHRSGHMLNNAVLRALFADRTAWRSVTSGGLTAAAA
jgi:UDP-3-O-[3-hydroxymyristoyl] N-acetylglucosamine deacetylase